MRKVRSRHHATQDAEAALRGACRPPGRPTVRVSFRQYEPRDPTPTNGIVGTTEFAPAPITGEQRDISRRRVRRPTLLASSTTSRFLESERAARYRHDRLRSALHDRRHVAARSPGRTTGSRLAATFRTFRRPRRRSVALRQIPEPHRKRGEVHAGNEVVVRWTVRHATTSASTSPFSVSDRALGFRRQA